MSYQELLKNVNSIADGWVSNGSGGGHHGSRGHLCPSQQSIHYHQHRHEEQCPHYTDEFKTSSWEWLNLDNINKNDSVGLSKEQNEACPSANSIYHVFYPRNPKTFRSAIKYKNWTIIPQYCNSRISNQDLPYVHKNGKKITMIYKLINERFGDSLYKI